MVATGIAYEIGEQFDLSVVEPRPALVPLTLGDGDKDLKELSGLSAGGFASCGKAKFKEAFLFTRRGVSGPTILQVSSYWTPNQRITFDLHPELNSGWLVQKKRDKPKAALRTILSDYLPVRFAQALANR